MNSVQLATAVAAGDVEQVLASFEGLERISIENARTIRAARARYAAAAERWQKAQGDGGYLPQRRAPFST
jgi:hypothetical protein